MEVQNILLITLVTAVVLFLVLREVLCWYFKFNRMVELLVDIRNSLGKGDKQ